MSDLTGSTSHLDHGAAQQGGFSFGRALPKRILTTAERSHRSGGSHPRNWGSATGTGLLHSYGLTRSAVVRFALCPNALEAHPDERRPSKPEVVCSNHAQGAVIVAQRPERRVVTPEVPVGFRSITPLEVAQQEEHRSHKPRAGVRIPPSRPRAMRWVAGRIPTPTERGSTPRSPANRRSSS